MNRAKTNKRGNPAWAAGGNGVGRCKTGRPKGSRNRIHRDIITDIIDVKEKLEAEGKSLYACSKADPVWFYENFYRALIPKNVQLSGDMQFEVSIPGVSVSMAHD